MAIFLFFLFLSISLSSFPKIFSSLSRLYQELSATFCTALFNFFPTCFLFRIFSLSFNFSSRFPKTSSSSSSFLTVFHKCGLGLTLEIQQSSTASRVMWWCFFCCLCIAPRSKLGPGSIYYPETHPDRSSQCKVPYHPQLWKRTPTFCHSLRPYCK